MAVLYLETEGNPESYRSQRHRRALSAASARLHEVLPHLSQKRESGQSTASAHPYVQR